MMHLNVNMSNRMGYILNTPSTGKRKSYFLRKLDTSTIDTIFCLDKTFFFTIIFLLHLLTHHLNFLPYQSVCILKISQPSVSERFIFFYFNKPKNLECTNFFFLLKCIKFLFLVNNKTVFAAVI